MAAGDRPSDGHWTMRAQIERRFTEGLSPKGPQATDSPCLEEKRAEKLEEKGAEKLEGDEWEDHWAMRAQIERRFTEGLSPKGPLPRRKRRPSFTLLAAGLKEEPEASEEARNADAADEAASPSPLDSWREPSNTIIMFDWDDTLCPSAYIWGDTRLRWDQVAPCYDDEPSIPATPAMLSRASGAPWSMLELLTAHSAIVASLLRLACSLGKVAIVTLAQDGWVHTSIAHFMPDLTGILEELDIQVVYARSMIPPRFLRQAHEEGQNVAKVLKTRAMSRTIKKFYGTGRKHGAERSWMNVLSIGDSTAERYAVQDVVLRRVQRDERLCRCKSLKMLGEPSLRRLTAELQIISTWLRTVVLHDGDVDLDFEELDEDSPLTPVRAAADSWSHSPPFRPSTAPLVDGPELCLASGDECVCEPPLNGDAESGDEWTMEVS